MEILHTRLAWYLAGPLLALLVIVLQWAANLPLGATGAIASLPTLARGRTERGSFWRLFFFIGMILGGFIFGRLSGDIKVSFDHGSFDSLTREMGLALKGTILLGAGLLIGFGARTAGGCTSGHGICGFSRGSTGSMVGTSIFLGMAVLTAHFIQWMFHHV